METIHGVVDFDGDTWLVVQKKNRWELFKPAVTISYYQYFASFNEFCTFLQAQEKCLTQ